MSCLCKYHDELISTRRHLHTMPEEGWSEFTTTAYIVEKLRKLGYEVLMGKKVINPDNCLGRSQKVVEAGLAYARKNGVSEELLKEMDGLTGCVGVMDTGRPGPTLAIRFDIDCVPVTESTDADHIPAKEGFCSTRPGLMHACGHDGHQAVAMALARFIGANAERLAGKIIFICQPAEEGSRGAYPILQSGVLHGVDTIFCGHIAPELEVGDVVAEPTKLLSTTKIDFEFTGRAAHAGAHPQAGRNALLAAANAAINIMALPRHEDGMTRVNVGQLHAGEGRNIVPSHAWMEVEVRGENAAVNRDLAADALLRAQGAAMSYGVECRQKIVGEAIDFVPDAAISQLITVCARRARGCAKVVPYWAVNGSDDGTLLMRSVQDAGGKAGYFIVGGAFAGNAVKPAVDFDERALVTLYDTWTNLIVALLGNWR